MDRVKNRDRDREIGRREGARGEGDKGRRKRSWRGVREMLA